MLLEGGEGDLGGERRGREGRCRGGNWVGTVDLDVAVKLKAEILSCLLEFMFAVLPRPHQQQRQSK